MLKELRMIAVLHQVSDPGSIVSGIPCRFRISVTSRPKRVALTSTCGSTGLPLAPVAGKQELLILFGSWLALAAPFAGDNMDTTTLLIIILVGTLVLG